TASAISFFVSPVLAAMSSTISALVMGFSHLRPGDGFSCFHAHFSEPPSSCQDHERQGVTGSPRRPPVACKVLRSSRLEAPVGRNAETPPARRPCPRFTARRGRLSRPRGAACPPLAAPRSGRCGRGERGPSPMACALLERGRASEQSMMYDTGPLTHACLD